MLTIIIYYRRASSVCSLIQEALGEKYHARVMPEAATVSENASIRKNSIVAGEYQGIKYGYPGQLRTTEV